MSFYHGTISGITLQISNKKQKTKQQSINGVNFKIDRHRRRLSISPMKKYGVVPQKF